MEKNIKEYIQKQYTMKSEKITNKLQGESCLKWD